MLILKLLDHRIGKRDEIIGEESSKPFHFHFRDEEIDGTWEAPRIDNPACKDAPGCGPWSAPMVPNPAYKGPWRAPLVDNPNYSVNIRFTMI